MSAAESVDKRLADGLMDRLRKAQAALDDALAAWRSAVAEASAARGRAEAARKAAVAAQLHGDPDEERRTQDDTEASAEADGAEFAAREARRALVNVVDDTECLALRAGRLTADMPSQDAARVARAANEVTERAAKARHEARLAPSPEETEQLRLIEREAAEQTAVADAAVVAETVKLDTAADASPPELTREALALGLLAQNPAITVVELARRVGVHRRTPYRWPRVKAALVVRKGGRAIRQVRGRSLDAATADDDESPRIARSSRPRRRRSDY